MNRFLSTLAAAALLAFASAGFADDKPADAAAPAVIAPADKPAEAAAAAEAPAATDAEPSAAASTAAPVPNKGDVAFMYTATALVILMTIPGLALFYGGLVRTKNMLSILMQVFVVFSLLAILWAVYGYSVAFTGGNPFFGGLSKAFLAGVTPDSLGATFSKGVVIPEMTFIAFQMTFAAITPCLIIGSFAERMKFSAILLFMIIWFTFSYLPLAHMVWYWDGPDAITDSATLATVEANAGYLWAKGALDFAGGTVVHINAGVAGLVGAYLVGKRIGYGKEALTPHSLTMTMIGASLLWVGWFGFNVGSNLEATGVAALAFLNTFVAAAAATLAWVFLEWAIKGRPSMLGGASGAVAGLVAITPACGFVGPMGAIVLGGVAGAVCLWGVTGLKRLLGADDALDVFGVHGLGGIIGALGTGIFASPSLGGTGTWDYVTNAAGTDYSISGHFMVQLTSVGLTIVWSAVVSFIAYKIVDMLVGLRVSEEREREGLDVTEHGESAYHY
jgi:ammonium transporter, Amt family